MAETHDTIKSLLAEFRGYAAGMPASYHVTMSWADFRRILDRFDAAHKREVREAVTGSNQLREVLRLCMGAMCKYCRADAKARGLPMECVNGCEVLLMAKDALAATEKEGGAK